MKHNTIISKGLSIILFSTLLFSCSTEDSLQNPNASNRATTSVVLNNITANMILTEEFPFKEAHRVNQYSVSNNSYYWGSNFYNWSNTEDRYSILKYVNKLNEESLREFGDKPNVYQALARFYKVYSIIWLSERVGDVPMKEAGDPNNLTPKFDTQKEVYKYSLELLEEANDILGHLISGSGAEKADANSMLDIKGDIFKLTNLQWQKVINSYRLRILISMSNRADEFPDLKIKESFSEIISNPTKYPIMDGNFDNMIYRYNAAFNPLPTSSSKPYAYGVNIGKTILDITTRTQDPRTFIFATPAPAKYNVAKTSIEDFASYVGASTNTSQASLNANTDTKGSTESDKGEYSYINSKRYFGDKDGSTAEPYVILSYSEMCFNIAEGIIRNWGAGNASEWYNKGIQASLDFYGLTDGKELEIGDRIGNTIGTVTVDLKNFFNQEEINLNTDKETAIKRILTQKYVALFCNSGYQAFYNWLRTGYPEFQENGEGIGTSNNKISRRWMYPVNEINYNSQNYLESIQRQYNGVDDITQDTWLFRK